MAPEPTPQQHLTEVIEGYFAQHGDTPLGVAWTRPELVAQRYEVMLDVVRRDPVRLRGGTAQETVALLDVGCGAAHLYDHLRAHGPDLIDYSGIDTSATFIDLCRSKHPEVEFRHVDILTSNEALPTCDYAVANGVLTIRADLSQDEMWAYAQRFIAKVFSLARRGVAFNVMSTHLDWERDDLFHVPFDTMAAFVRRELSRHFSFRQDYGAYEYTTYVYRDQDAD